MFLAHNRNTIENNIFISFLQQFMLAYFLVKVSNRFLRLQQLFVLATRYWNSHNLFSNWCFILCEPCFRNNPLVLLIQLIIGHYCFMWSVKSLCKNMILSWFDFCCKTLNLTNCSNFVSHVKVRNKLVWKMHYTV